MLDMIHRSLRAKDGISSLSCPARLILAILLSLRCIVQIEIGRCFHWSQTSLGTAGKNLPHLGDRPIVEIQDANRSLVWARLSQLWHQTSAVCAGYYCLRRNSTDPFFTPVRLSFDSNEFSRRQASLRRVVRNRGSRFDLRHPVCG